MKSIIVGLTIAAIAAGAGAVVKVSVLEERISGIKELVFEIKQDTREIKEQISIIKKVTAN